MDATVYCEECCESTDIQIKINPDSMNDNLLLDIEGLHMHFYDSIISLGRIQVSLNHLGMISLADVIKEVAKLPNDKTIY